MAHDIKIIRDIRRTKKGYLTHRGWQEVHVDGKLWGRLSQQTHGCHGSTHELRQVEKSEPDGYIITETSSSGRFEHTKYKEWSDKTYKFHLDPNVGFIPLPERLWEMVKRAIKAGDLIDPDELEGRRERERDKWREERLEEQFKKDVRFDLRARHVVAVMRDNPEDEAKIVDEIKAAMKWATEND